MVPGKAVASLLCSKNSYFSASRARACRARWIFAGISVLSAFQRYGFGCSLRAAVRRDGPRQVRDAAGVYDIIPAT